MQYVTSRSIFIVDGFYARVERVEGRRFRFLSLNDPDGSQLTSDWQSAAALVEIFDLFVKGKLYLRTRYTWLDHTTLIPRMDRDMQEPVIVLLTTEGQTIIPRHRAAIFRHILSRTLSRCDPFADLY